MTSHSERTSGFLFSLPGTNRLACLEQPGDIPPGHRTCFPHYTKEETEAAVAAAIAAIKSDLEAGLESYHRVTAIWGTPPKATAQRAWSVCDPIGRELRCEVIDAVPIPWLRSLDWPKTPKATTATERSRTVTAE